MQRTLTALALVLTCALHAQTVYNYTIPTTFQSVNSYTQFTFPATPPTTGDATLTLQWLACHQSGFGGSSITVQINTSNGWVTILYDPNNFLECTFITENITIPSALLSDAIATGGGSVQCRVDCDDSCQAGVGCSFYNDPVVSGITLTYTAHAADLMADDTGVCPGSTVHFTDLSINTPTSYQWSFPGATPSSSTQQNPTVQYPDAGTYPVTLIVETADGMDTLTLQDYITVFALPPAEAGVDEALCQGDTAQLQASGGVSYQWFPSIGLNNALIAAPLAFPATSTSYTVLVTDANGCEASDFMVLSVQQLPTVVASAGNNTICLGDTAYIVAVGAQLYNWSPNLFISGVSGAAVHAWPTSTFTWNVTGTDGFGCMNDTSITITVVPPPMAPMITNLGMQLISTAATGYQWFLDGQAIEGATAQTYAPVVNGNYSVMITDGNGCSAQSLPVYFGTAGMRTATATPLRAYPQPAGDQLVVEGAPAGARLRLVSSSGAVVWSGAAQRDRTTIDLKDLAAGAYALEVVGSSVERLPVIKQ